MQEVWIDPGIGFGKTPSHNWSLLRHLDALVGTGYPVLVGTSRKRFLGLVTAASDGRPDGDLDAGGRPARGVGGHGSLGDGARSSDGAGA